MAALSFSVTWDYRCPFARNASEHILDGLADGADWDVTWVPFSLGQVHVAEGEPDIWETPEKDSGLLALQVGTVVRDRHPDRFADVHRALYAARHDESRKLQDREVVVSVLEAHGLDPESILAEVDAGAALEVIRKEHEAIASDYSVWGVPTFVAGDQAVFVRLMDRPRGDGPHARRSIERIIDLLTSWPQLNEFKHPTRER